MLDKERITEMVEKHIGLVYLVMGRYKYHRKLPAHIMSKEDMFQSGVEGLIWAANHFDPEKGAFSTYALPCIKGFILRAFRSARKELALAREAGHEGIRFIPFSALENDETGELYEEGIPDEKFSDELSRLELQLDVGLEGIVSWVDRTLGAGWGVCFRYWLAEGKVTKELADQMGVSRQACDKRVKKAIRRVRKQFFSPEERK